MPGADRKSTIDKDLIEHWKRKHQWNQLQSYGSCLDYDQGSCQCFMVHQGARCTNAYGHAFFHLIPGNFLTRPYLTRVVEMDDQGTPTPACQTEIEPSDRMM